MPPSNLQLLVTKNRVPPLPPAWVARPRLTGRLIEALRHKLVLISAPAGYGKTTLIHEAISSFKEPVGWISLDASDNTPLNFWSYFIAALQNIQPGICQSVLNALRAPRIPTTDWLLTNLLNAISGFNDDFAIVLDDYHLISSQAIHDALIFIIEHLPPQAHLVIVSRIDPPLPLARWRVKGEIAEIRADELSFTSGEAAAFFKNTAGIDLSEKDLAILENRTEGWIAGLKMAALSLQGKKDVSGYIQAFSGSNRYILDYLAEEVLNRQPPGIKQFLMESSVLERLCGPLCDAVTGRNDSQATLIQLESANLFISPLDDERRWYRYHPLFATILRNQLARFEPEKINLLHRQASRWHEKEGFLPESIDHALSGGELERAAVLVENIAPVMLGQNQAVMLLEYASRLPEPVVLDSPWLCVCFAWAALVANKPESLSRMLSRAVESLSENPEKLSPHSRANLQRIKGHTLSIRSFVAQAQNDIPRAIQLAEEANRELPGNSIDDLLARAVNSLNLAHFYENSGDITRAIPYIDDLIEAGRKVNYYYAIVGARGSLAEIEMQLSRLDQAAGICKEAIEWGTQWGGACPLPSTAHAYIVLGQINYQQNDLSSAVKNLTRGIEIGESGFNWEPVLKGYLHLAEVEGGQGHPETASGYLQRAEKVGPFVFVPPEFYQIPARQACLALRQGNINAASDWARRQEVALPLSQLPAYHKEFDYLTLIRLKLAEGDCKCLPEYLDRFITNAGRQMRNAVVIEALVLKAQALDCLGETVKALEALDHALSMAWPAGYVRTFIDEGAPVARLLQKLVAGRNVEYASKLLSLMAIRSPGKSLPLSDKTPAPGLMEALSEREMEVLKLIAAGKSNKEIGSELFLATGTVKKHINNIFTKLDVKSRTQAAARARELGII